MPCEEAIVLAGGQGTRLRSAVPDRPKPLAPVNGRPFLHFVLENLAGHGFRRVILATGYRSEMIESAMGKKFGNLDLVYSREEKPLGTGGALALAMTHAITEPIVALNGDTLLDIDYRRLAGLLGDGEIVMSGVFREDASRFGSLVISGERVVGFQEKGGSRPGWINAGCYLLAGSIFGDSWQNRPFSFESDFMPELLKESPAPLCRVEGEFWDIGVPEEYYKFIERYG